MSAPERFQVGDTVRCVEGWPPNLIEGAEYQVEEVSNGYVYIDVDDGGWWPRRFAPVRPMPPALNPANWDTWALHRATYDARPTDLIDQLKAWGTFCYWASSSNLAAHFLPTTPAARTRASNGRDVPVETVLVELPVEVATWYAEVMAEPEVSHDYPGRVGVACRRALGGEA